MSIYLYVKQCEHCGLRYFGKTINSDINKYRGSGHYWLRHINKHGKNISTVETWAFNDPLEAKKFALKFSHDNNIVHSNKWANLILEDGLDGNSSDVITQELRDKFRKANTGKNNPSYGTIWITNGFKNAKIKNTDIIPNGWVKGRYFVESFLKSFVSRSKVGRNNPRFDDTIYVFKNEATGEKYKETSYNFSEKMQLRKKCIRELVKGKRENYKGWKVTDF
jgi:hypothetical protein